MTANIEKLFFNYTLYNKQYIPIVHGSFFENNDIMSVYNVIRNEFMESNDKIVPSVKEIINLCELYNLVIDKEFIKALCKSNVDDYRDEFTKKRYENWVKKNSLLNGLVSAFESIKDLDKHQNDINGLEEKINKIKNKIDDSINLKLNSGNIGLDFDNVEDHDQQDEINKIPTGISCFDAITEGGFDRKTFSVFMGAPGSGKSLTLQNIAVNCALNGYNVGYITLELSEKKSLKRIGSMRLEIPIKEYTERVKDKEWLKERIKLMNNKGQTLFDNKVGKLYIKEYPSGTATISDLDAYCQQVKDETGYELDMLVVDYIQIMNTEKGVDRNMLYLKGEHLSVGLRAIGQKRNMAVVTAVQTDKNKYGANSLSLNDIPESKAIADTADQVWGIILTPLMRQEGIYHWQWLKLRDSSTDYERISFKFNKEILKLYDDEYIKTTLT